jgi:hypothetical protein
MSKKAETEKDYLTRLRKVVAENNKLETASVNRQFRDLTRQQPTVIREFPPIPSKEYTIETKTEWKDSVKKFLMKSALIGDAISTGFERLSAPASAPVSTPLSAPVSTIKGKWTNEQLDDYIDKVTPQMGKKFGGKKKNKSRKVTKPRQRTTRKRA